MANEHNLHKGHRQRLLKKYLENGIQSLEEHEVLEILLFFAFSRCNTNELSHMLIEKFGSVSQVLNASPKEMTEINGVGETAAALLRFLGDFVDTYGRVKEPVIKLEGIESVITFCQEFFPNEDKESCHFILLDKRKYLAACLNMTGCAFSLISVDLKQVISKAFNVNASSVIIVHNHPEATSAASNNDVRYTRSMAETFTALNINVVDHIIIGNDGCFSMRKAKLLEDLWS